MADNDQDKHLPASARKLRKARSEGQVARSRDLSHFAAIAAGGALLIVLAPRLSEWFKQWLGQGLSFNAAMLADPATMTDRLADFAAKLMLFVVPAGGVMMAVGIAANLASGGWNWTLKPLAPKFDKFNPLTGIGRLFSKDQLVQTLKACVLALILGAIGALYLKSHLDEFNATLSLPLPAALSQTGDMLRGGLILLVLALALFAVVDVPLQRYLHASRLKMSHQEVKQEHKEVEGNSEVKAKVRARMREMTRRRMLAAVPRADLVVMNPTHYAVALRYDDGSMTAPRVVAKGADLLAMRIRDLARESKVPVLQAPVLARALYAHAELDREIPAALFAAVAQVLAYVYQLRAALAGRGAMPGSLPELNVPAELDPHHAKAAPPSAANVDE
jgi:flagellar biosynthesis protein FlhB